MRFVCVCVAVLLACVSARAQHQPPPFSTVEDFDRCTDDYNPDACLKAAETLLKKKPALAFELGKHARLHLQHWAALRFFEPALARKPGARCSDADVSMAVVSGLALPGHYPDFARAKRVFTGSCFAALRPAVDKNLGDGGYLTTNVCAIYGERNVVEAKCAPAPVAAPVVVREEKLPAFNRKAAVIGTLKVYVGPEGERVTVGEVTGKPGLFLVRFDGVRGAYNGKVVLHKEELSGDRITYWTEVDGARWVSIAGRRWQGYTDLTAYVPEHPGEFSIRYDAAESKAAKADVLK